MKNFVGIVDRRYRYAIEVRQPSWFNDDFYKFLRAGNICLVWNQLDVIRAPPVVTTDFVYLRFIGDRSIQEHKFGRIQKDRTQEMAEWAAELNKVVDGLSSASSRRITIMQVLGPRLPTSLDGFLVCLNCFLQARRAN